jgi:hypothetical protein
MQISGGPSDVQDERGRGCATGQREPAGRAF